MLWVSNRNVTLKFV